MHPPTHALIAASRTQNEAEYAACFLIALSFFSIDLFIAFTISRCTMPYTARPDTRSTRIARAANTPWAGEAFGSGGCVCVSVLSVSCCYLGYVALEVGAEELCHLRSHRRPQCR